jgi:hypothetical protein
MAIWAKHAREKFRKWTTVIPDHVERLVSANVLCELVSPEAFILLVRLCGASSARIHFGTVINDRSNSDQIRVPPICAIKKKICTTSDYCDCRGIHAGTSACGGVKKG